MMKRTLKICRIAVYRASLPLHEGSYKWSRGKSIEAFDTTVVEVVTDCGVAGYGECCPLGSSYIPAFPEGTRAGIRQLAPDLLGMDPTNVSNINIKMDHFLKGHSSSKSAIDMACWDIFGKVTGAPVCDLLGGRLAYDNEGFSLYRAISQDTPDTMSRNVKKYMVDDGYRKFQLKVGGEYREDIERIIAVRHMIDTQAKEMGVLEAIPLICDANAGWKRHEAMQVINAVKGLDVFIEQPCETYEECVSVRNHCPLPFILDESMDSVGMLTRILADKSADAINLKISKVGGLTKARMIRDLAVACGIPMNIEDTWGGDIVTSAICKCKPASSSQIFRMILFILIKFFYCSPFGPFHTVRFAPVLYRLQ